MSIVCQLFRLPRIGNLLHSDLEQSFVEEKMRRMVEYDTPQASTLKLSWFRPKYKLLVSIISRCFYGLLGSFNQVSAA